MPARHCRVGFVSSSIDNAVEVRVAGFERSSRHIAHRSLCSQRRLTHSCQVLAAVAAQLRKDASKDKWTLPKHGAHFRSSGVATQGKARAATGLEHAPPPLASASA